MENKNQKSVKTGVEKPVNRTSTKVEMICDYELSGQVKIVQKEKGSVVLYIYDENNKLLGVMCGSDILAAIAREEN